MTRIFAIAWTPVNPNRRYAGLKGLSNGELLDAAEKSGFDVLITVDQNMPHQQNLAGRAISLIILSSRTTNVEDLAALKPEIIAGLSDLRPGEVLLIRAGSV